MEALLKQIRLNAQEKLKEIAKSEELNDFRVKFLGKKGELTQVLRGMGGLSPEERPRVGQLVNELRDELEGEISKKQQEISQVEKARKLQEEAIDVTLPAKPLMVGKRHPLTLVLDEIKRVFLGMGFTISEGPEVETDYYSFEALNIPKGHPAREMQDTFYISDEIVLRPHTSPVQIRTMEKQAPNPIKIIAPGKVYRRDADSTHSPMFQQVEGLVIDKGITLGDLKGILESFVKQIFGEDRKIRLRPSFFPFTEPSAEVDVSCVMCGGSGCRVCSHTGWLEILGSGMVHPRVLEMAGYNPEEVSGFAFGMGVERIAMLKYGIADIRLFFENDMRFLKQF